MNQSARANASGSRGAASACFILGGLAGWVACGGNGSGSSVTGAFSGQGQDVDASSQDAQSGEPPSLGLIDAPSLAPDAGTPIVTVDPKGSSDSGAPSAEGSAAPTIDAPVEVSTDTSTAGVEGGVRADGGAGVPPCSAGKYVLCEDFESTAVGAIPSGWTATGQAAVTADDAYVSKHSLKFTVPSGGAANYRSISTDASKIGSSHWGRVYLRAEAPMPSYFAHDTFVYLTGNGPTKGSEQVRVVDTVMQANHSHQFLYNVQPSGSEFGKVSDYRYTWDAAWHCAEWHLDNPQQSYHFYFDSVEVAQIAVDNGAGNYANSDIPMSFSRLTLAVNQYQNPPPGYNQRPVWVTAWIDALAIDVNRIGCH